MKKTDFSKIAYKYDKNKFRNEISPDFDLKKYINESKSNRFKLLDLACGTGLYLKKQIEYFNNEHIEWYGLDASKEMLEKAKEKLQNVNLTLGVAEELPYEDNYFDYIIINYAFHHFERKSDALDEIKRVLKTNGILKMYNTSIYDMKNWWIYKFFPSTYYEDLKRYWKKELIFAELKKRNFEVEVNVKYKLCETKVKDFIDYVYNRDISVLNIIPDSEYKQGLEQMEYLINKDSDSKILNDFAHVTIIAKKV